MDRDRNMAKNTAEAMSSLSRAVGGMTMSDGVQLDTLGQRLTNVNTYLQSAQNQLNGLVVKANSLAKLVHPNFNQVLQLWKNWIILSKSSFAMYHYSMILPHS